MQTSVSNGVYFCGIGRPGAGLFSVEVTSLDLCIGQLNVLDWNRSVRSGISSFPR